MKALLLVDIQNDFLPGGALAVPEGDKVIPIANHLMEQGDFDFIVATQDYHPAHHLSFASEHPGHKPGDVILVGGVPQTLWPNHCVQGTSGVLFAPSLNLKKISKIIQKGTLREVDSYSAFFDNARQNQTELHSFLQSQTIDDLMIVGLATDYCVLFSVMDALELGYKVTVVPEGCRGVNLSPNDSEVALQKMKKAGALIEPLARIPN